jgi:hypothetical protein
MTAHQQELQSYQRAQHPARRIVQMLEPIGVLILFLIAAIWVGGAYSNGDPLWFYAKFDQQPAAIRIYHYGEVQELRPDDAGFADLVAAVNAQISQHAGYAESIHPHDSSLEHYQTKGFAVELIYDRAVLVHTRYFFPAAPRLMIALDGSYNYISENLLFRGSLERYLPGGIVLNSTEAIRTTVTQVLSSTVSN